MEALANITSHNARAAQIRKFVADPPKRAVTLRLVTVDDPPQTIGEWDATQCRGNGALSLEISALCEEHATTTQRHMEAVLGWQSAEGRTVVTKRLRARYTPPAEADEDELDQEALGITGTTLGQVVQMQRHLEVQTRSTHTFMHGLMQTALQLNGQLSAQLQDSYNRIHELQQQQIESAAATVAEYQEAVGEAPIAGVDPAAEARTQALQVVTQIAQTFGPTLIQAALVRLTSPASPIQLPPAAPPAAASQAPSSPTPPAAPTAPAAAAAAVAVPDSSATAAAAPIRRAQRAATTRPTRAPPRGRK